MGWFRETVMDDWLGFDYVDPVKQQEQALQKQKDLIDTQTAEQWMMDLMNALMTAGKIPVMDISDPQVRADFVSTMDEMGYDLSNPFPGYLEQPGEAIISAINEASDSINFTDLMREAQAISPQLKQNVIDGQEALNSIYNGELEAAMQDNFASLQTYFQGMKDVNDLEAGRVKNKQDNINVAGDNLATSAENVGAGTRDLLIDKKATAESNNQNIFNTAEKVAGDINDITKTGLASIADTTKEGSATIFDADKEGIEGIFDAEVGSAGGVRDATYGAAEKMEGAQIDEAGVLGNQMRRTAMVGRRAAEDAYNDALKGMRTKGIGQGTGTNMRSSMAQNRARQAQDMFAPMAQADSIQTGLESDARLGRVGAENQADVDFSKDQGLAGIGKATNLATAGVNRAITDAGADLSEATGIAASDTTAAQSVGGAEINKAAQQGEIGENFINNLIDSGMQRDTAQVSGAEIRLGNKLRDLGFDDAEVNAMKKALGYDMEESDAGLNLYQDLMNTQLANLGLNANQVGLLKYLNSAPTEISLGGLDSIARYSSPYTQRVLAPGYQSYINTSPYVPVSSGSDSNWMTQLMKFSDIYNKI